MISHFNSVLSKDFIPLSYVLCEQEIPTPDAIYNNEHQFLVAIAPLAGNKFKQDNVFVLTS